MSSEEEEFQGDESSEEEFQGDEEEEEEELAADDESDDDDDDDVPLVALKKTSQEESDDDDDDDDDIPLASLKGTSPKKKKTKPTATKKTKTVVKKATEAKAAKPKKTKKATTKSEPAPTTSNGSYRSASAALYGSNSKKGMLIQRLLCRWWYAMTWPDNLPDVPPKHYDSLDGLPGVYICTSGSEVGHIRDMRDRSKCPNFVNFAKKTSSELQDMLLVALKAQKQALIQAEGSGTSTEKEINEMIKWTEKVKPEAADKEAVKVLKAAKLSLP